MDEWKGDINIYNPDKAISEQVTLKRIVQHDVAMNLARTGVPDIPSERPLSHNERMQFRFKGLNEVISAQQGIINSNTRSIVRTNDENKWRKKNKTEEDREKNPFGEEDNDYNELMAILSFLNDCEQRIILARKTKMVEDDFLIERIDHEGEVVLELTNNFFDMLKDLEDSYEVVYSILLKNKIVSSGFTVDEELEDKKKDEEFLRRVVSS